MWIPSSSLIVSEIWSFSLPIEGELFRITHSCPSGYGRGLICQASNDLIPDLFDVKQLYFRPERELFLFERPAPFIERRIGIRAFENRDDWIVSIEFWSDTVPLFPDSNPSTSSTGTTTSVAASTTSVSLIAANTSRKGLSIYNSSSVGTLYIAYGATASLTAFAEKISPNTLWEMPIQYTGAIAGIWSATGGSAAVTEFT